MSNCVNPSARRDGDSGFEGAFLYSIGCLGCTRQRPGVRGRGLAACAVGPCKLSWVTTDRHVIP